MLRTVQTYQGLTTDSLHTWLDKLAHFAKPVVPIQQSSQALCLGGVFQANEAELKELAFICQQQIEWQTLTPYQYQDYRQALMQGDREIHEPTQAREQTLSNNLASFERLLEQAITQQVSDIHIEILREYGQIRWRQQGLLVTQQTLTLEQHEQLCARLKVLAELDLAEKRRPQDGRLPYQHSQGECVDIRIATLPTLYGEKVVLRLINQNMLHWGLDQLGLPTAAFRLLKQALDQPQGLILITGPTGSGKTVTLYSALRELNHPQRNITTVEDPIEMAIAGINQVATQNAIGLDFARTLKAMLRQDPDIIMLGEIRDEETAQTAVRAAQTGHLVLSTLHTNGVLASRHRLIDMGVADYLLNETLLVIIAQRLVRRLCPDCRIPFPAPTTHHHASSQYFQACSDGCSNCQQGYHGRLALYEIINQGALQAHDNGGEIAAEAWWTLQQSAQQALDQGLTSRAEVARVLGQHTLNKGGTR